MGKFWSSVCLRCGVRHTPEKSSAKPERRSPRRNREFLTCSPHKYGETCPTRHAQRTHTTHQSNYIAFIYRFDIVLVLRPCGWFYVRVG